MPHGITQCYLPPGRGDIHSSATGDRLPAGMPSRCTSQLGQLSLASLLGSLNRVPASAGVRAGISPPPNGR